MNLPLDLLKKQDLSEEELLLIAEYSPFIQLTPMSISTPLVFVTQFEQQVSRRNFLTAAARFIEPYAAAELITCDTVRQVIFARLHCKISELDFTSFLFLVLLAALSKQEAPLEFSQNNVFDEYNAFWQQRNSIQNSMSMTVKTLQTQVRDLHSPEYNCVKLIALTLQLERLNAKAEEEHRFEDICAQICEAVARQFELIEEAYGTLSCRKVYRDATDFSRAQQTLILASIAAIPVLKLENFAQQCAEKREVLQRKKNEIRELFEQQKSIVESQTNNIFLINNTAITKDLIYKPFDQLTEEEQNEIKFESTSNLYRYVCMKRQIGVSSSERLFANSQLRQRAEENCNSALEQQKRKQELEQARTQEMEYANSVLSQAVATTNAAVLVQKSQQVSNLPMLHIEESPRELQPTGIVASQKTAVALPFDAFCESVTGQLFESFQTHFGTENTLKRMIDVLITCRGIYCRQFFNQGGYELAFCQLSSQIKAPRSEVQYDQVNSSVDSTLRVKQQVSTSQVVLIDENGAQRTCQASNNVCDISLEDLQPETHSEPSNEQFLQEQVSDFRLIADTTATAQFHLLLMKYVRELQERAKVGEIERSISTSSRCDEIEKQVVQLRILANYFGEVFLRGQAESGYIVYSYTVSDIVDYLLSDQELLNQFDDQEVANLLIFLYKLPYYENYFRLLQKCFRRAYGANALIQAELREILQDVWIYATCNEEERALGLLLYEGE